MSLADIRARLAALRSASPAVPTVKRPPMVAAVRERVRPEKPSDAAGRPDPGAPAVQHPPGQAGHTSGVGAIARGGPVPLQAAPEAAELELPARTPGGAVTISRKELLRESKLARRRLGPKERPVDVERPKTRGDCFGGERPCPFVSCRYHTYLDVTEAGSLVINHPDVDPAELKASCSLDLADRGPIRLEDVGQVLNVTRERVRQMETAAMQNLAVAIDPKAAAAAGVPGARFVGSCKARCALTGKVCALPAHGKQRKHRVGQWEFHLVALAGQTYFPRANEVDGYAERREAVDG
jgi:hypothetical protein